MIFASPSVKYKDSFLDSLGDETDNLRLIWPAETIKEDFSAFVQRLLDYQEGKNLPDKWVPQTTHWLIDNNKYIGQVVIRHRLEPPDNYFFGHIGVFLVPEYRKKAYPLLLGRKAINECKKMYKEGKLELYNSGILATCNKNNVHTPRMAKVFGFEFLQELPCPQMGEGVVFKYFLYEL